MSYLRAHAETIDFYKKRSATTSTLDANHLLGEHVETIDFYKKHCTSKFNLNADHFYFSLCCCFISTNSWQNVPRMLSVHTGLFVTSGQSDFALWVVSSQRLGFLSLKGREPICLWRFNLGNSHTTRCGLFFETAHCSHKEKGVNTHIPFWIW